MTSRKLGRLPLIGTGIVPPSVGAPAGSFRSTRKTVSDTGRMRADSVRPDAANGRAVKLRHSPVKSLGDCLEHAGITSLRSGPAGTTHLFCCRAGQSFGQ